MTPMISIQSGKHVARLASQLLNGAAPTGFSVEAVEYLLAVNLRTADLTDLTVPNVVLTVAEMMSDRNPPAV